MQSGWRVVGCGSNTAYWGGFRGFSSLGTPLPNLPHSDCVGGQLLANGPDSVTSAPDLTISGSATIDGGTLFAPLTLTLGAGAWTCLLGGSGVGKTTVLRLIAGLETGATFRGQITASDGLPVMDRVAYMAQDDLLLPGATVAQNVSLGARLRGEKPRSESTRPPDQTDAPSGSYD